MPIYEYECPSCSCKFEQRRSFTDESPALCPKCKCESRRVFSPVPIIFKGSGFYVTDHKADHGHSAPTGGTEQADSAKSADSAKPKAASTTSSKDSSAG